MSATSVPPAAEVIPRQRTADPDFWLTVAAWAVVAFAVLQILLFGHGRDQSIYATVGEGILRGKMPYRDLWDFKPPGIFYVYALAQALFGKSMLAPRMLEAAGMIAMVFAFRSLGRSYFGLRRVGTVGGAVACLVLSQLEFWHSGQPEQYGGFLSVFALVLVAKSWPRNRRVLVLLGVGALFGLAFLFKPPLGGGALVAAAYLARRDRVDGFPLLRQLSNVAWLGAGSVAPLVICALWFKLRGAWPALAWTLFEFTPGYTKLGWGYSSVQTLFYWAVEQTFFSFSALLGGGVLAALIVRPLHEREREGVLLLLGLVSVQLAGVVMQAKFFAYHYGATLPLVGLIAGLGYYKLWRRFLMMGPSGGVGFAGFVAVVASMRLPVRDLEPDYWDRSARRTRFALRGAPGGERERLDRDLYRVADFNLDASRQVALELARRVDPARSVFVWGFEPLVYWASERRPASRYIYDVPQRAQWERTRARTELMAELAADPPAMIVVQHNDTFRFVTGDDLDSARALATFPELDRLVDERYELVKSIEDFDLYERKEP